MLTRIRQSGSNSGSTVAVRLASTSARTLKGTSEAPPVAAEREERTLLPEHKKGAALPEEELKEQRAEELKGKPLALGDSPWLWRGRKRRR